MSKRGGHNWNDDALAGRGGWIADARFTCLRCGAWRRMIYQAATDYEKKPRVSIYFVGGRRVEKSPSCVDGGQDEEEDAA